MKVWTLLNLMVASLIFFPSKEYSQTPEDYGLAYENVQLKTEDGIQIAAWYLPARNSKATIFLLHGNAGNIGDRLFKAAGWVKRGYSFFMLDYRSYGESSGKISGEDDLYRDAEAGLKWLETISPSRVGASR